MQAWPNRTAIGPDGKPAYNNPQTNTRFHMRDLTDEEILQVSGGCADFSEVTATVTSTAEIVEPTNKAWVFMMMQLLR